MSRPDLQVGVACAADPLDPAAYSGVPLGIVQGLGAIGVEPVPIAARLPGDWQRRAQFALAAAKLRPRPVREFGLRATGRRNQTRLLASRNLERARSLAARIAVRRSPLAGCIQFGTEFSLPKRASFITYDDMTVAQAIAAYPYDWITRLSPSELDYLVERQRLVFERARVCCATTRWAADSLVRDYGIPESRVRVVGIGATNLAREAPPATGRFRATCSSARIGCARTATQSYAPSARSDPSFRRRRSMSSEVIRSSTNPACEVMDYSLRVTRARVRSSRCCRRRPRAS